MGLIFLLLLIILLLSALPAWPYSRGWGYFPSGLMALLLVLLVFLILTERVVFIR